MSFASSGAPMMWYCVEKSRSATGSREFCASRVSMAITVCAFFAAASGSSPSSLNMFVTCWTKSARSLTDFSSVFV